MRATSRSDDGTRATLVGNRLMLIGAVLYLLEWVAIVAADVTAPLGAESSRHDLLAAYAGREDALAWAAGWFSVALLGRVLIIVGLRAALRDSGRPQLLMDLAVPAMAISVALEIATYAIPPGAAWALDNGAGLAAVRGLDAASFAMGSMIWGPIGVALLCSGLAMWQSRLFAWPLWVLAVISGAAAIVVGAATTAPSSADLAAALQTVAALAFWVWMLWAGVLLWRRGSPRPATNQQWSEPSG